MLRNLQRRQTSAHGSGHGARVGVERVERQVGTGREAFPEALGEKGATCRSKLISDQEKSCLLRLTDSKLPRKLAGRREEPGIATIVRARFGVVPMPDVGEGELWRWCFVQSWRRVDDVNRSQTMLSRTKLSRGWTLLGYFFSGGHLPLSGGFHHMQARAPSATSQSVKGSKGLETYLPGQSKLLQFVSVPRLQLVPFEIGSRFSRRPAEDNCESVTLQKSSNTRGRLQVEVSRSGVSGDNPWSWMFVRQFWRGPSLG